MLDRVTEDILIKAREVSAHMAMITPNDEWKICGIASRRRTEKLERELASLTEHNTELIRINNDRKNKIAELQGQVEGMRPYMPCQTCKYFSVTDNICLICTPRTQLNWQPKESNETH
jgi:predicted RNase H-like nuclease (RuvC/YqgF family)